MFPVFPGNQNCHYLRTMLQSIIQGAEGAKSFEIEFQNGNAGGTLNGKPFQWDVLQTGPSTWHVLLNEVSYTIVLDAHDTDNHAYTLSVNGKQVIVSTLDKMQLLLKSMGIDHTASAKLNEVKAPMPGLVLRIEVEEGQAVHKGDNLLVLEAMKMENMIKAPGDAIIGKIRVNPGVAVEKNQVLIQFS
jgi:biotin carboxyl carrier protein